MITLNQGIDASTSDLTADVLTSGLTPERVAKLMAPLPLNEGHEVRVQQEVRDGTGAQWLVYTTEDPIRERLTDVDPNWSLELANITVQQKFASVTVALTVHGVTRIGTGGAAVKRQDKDTDQDVVKAATTDAFKRASRMFGVGAYLLHAPKIYTDWIAKPQGKEDWNKRRAYEEEAMRKFADWYHRTFAEEREAATSRGQNALNDLRQHLDETEAAQDRFQSSGQDNPRRIGSQPQPQGKGGPPNGKDQPWQDKIAGWNKSQWGKFWAEMGRRGLDEAAVHKALGVQSVKDFQGTYGELNDRIKQAAAGNGVQTSGQDSQAVKVGAVRLEGDEGQFTVYSVEVRGTPGQLPEIRIHALSPDGVVDPMPALLHPVNPKDLNRWFGAQVPRPMPAEWSYVYRLNDDLILIAEWNRDPATGPVLADLLAE